MGKMSQTPPIVLQTSSNAANDTAYQIGALTGMVRSIEGAISDLRNVIACTFDAPRFVRRLEMTAQPLFQFGTVTLHPTPDRRMIRPPDHAPRTILRHRAARASSEDTSAPHKESARRRLPPLEDCRSGCVLHNRSGYQPNPPNLQHIPMYRTLTFASIEGDSIGPLDVHSWTNCRRYLLCRKHRS
jgi:hypothetical protein